MSALGVRRVRWTGRLRRGLWRLRVSLRAVVCAGLVAVVLGCGWLWLRTSPLVRIQQVEVTGLSGPDVPQIRGALVAAAEQMTTLAVNLQRLDAAVARFPDVHSLSVSTQFPHGAVIRVNEQVPVATIEAGGRTELVDDAGEFLTSSLGAAGPLPSIQLPQSGTAALESAGARADADALGAAPYALLAHIASATFDSAHGVVLELRHGPELYFGAPTQLHAKWLAAIAVLADQSSAGAGYIDVSYPTRPAAGATVGPG